MSHIWTFSTSSEPLLQRCIEAALQQTTDNKWTRHFGYKHLPPSTKSEPPAEKVTTEIIEIPTSPPIEEKKEEEVSSNYDDFIDGIENEIHLDLITKECSKNPNLLSKMAQKLSLHTVEQLFNLVFAADTIEESFLTDLFLLFLPLHIKFQHSWRCADLLAKTEKQYPDIFKKLLIILLEDVDIPNLVLSNYVATLDKERITNFVEILSGIEMSSQTFVHNILTIHTAYKGCKKTEKTQDFVKTILLQHGKSCTTDRNYGSLFLTYLQTEKLLEHQLSKQLEDCLEKHHSPFKKPCSMLMKRLVIN